MEKKKRIFLPFSKVIEISFKNLRMRFWRSVITTSGVVLGIAFLMSILTTSIIQKELLQKGSVEIQAQIQSKEDDSSAKQIWLVSLSLIVCLTGITNSLFMSVTERYKEIGTMKCLGALDSFIRRIFMIEALFQGLAGSIAGILLGSIFSILASVFKYGVIVFQVFPLVTFINYVFLTMFFGIIISVLGAVFPASRAARMAPVEAMRTEV